MYESDEFSLPVQPEVEPISRSVSFPDHYLLPYIEYCKRSKCITCGCSIMFLCLAIICFFATNYMINYPATVSRKIAFVFAGVFCIVCGVTCLELRFRIFKQCRDGPGDNVQFEIARRDARFSITSSFLGHFEAQETSFYDRTHKEEPNQIETPEDSSYLGYSTDDEAYVSDTSTYKFTGPRHSISDGLSPNSPLLPFRKPLEISRPFLTCNGVEFKGLQNDGATLNFDHYLRNYSTFVKENITSETEPLLTPSTFENGCVVAH